jgi:hypothetical protein
MEGTVYPNPGDIVTEMPQGRGMENKGRRRRFS